jgi:DNA-binding MarR family transcriptional regulator
VAKIKNKAQAKMYSRPGYQLKVAQNVLRVTMENRLRDLRLTVPKYAVLQAIALEPGISNADLSRFAFVTPQTMQAVLAGLERDGYVTRSPHPQHGRILMSDLTPQGHEILKQAHDAVAGVEEQMLAGLSREDVRTLTRLLGQCVENLT